MHIPFAKYLTDTKENNRPFSDRDLYLLVFPLFIERLLQMFVGMMDTFIISYTGEASVSGVSLIDQVSNVYIFVSTAIAAGGAVITSQYIGSKNKTKAGESASQLLMISTVFAIIIASLTYTGKSPLLHFLFGKVEDDVMTAAITYLAITALSYPMIAIYDSGAALYRSLGMTHVTMKLSILSNLINLVGNFIGVFILHAGVAGVAWPTLFARSFQAIVITVLCFKKDKAAYYRLKHIFRFNADLLKRILHVAVPNGIENGVFQFVKVAMSSIVSLFGTTQIAANGIAQTFWSLTNSFGNAGGPAFTTVIGQCMGDENVDAAEYYFKRFARMLVWIGGGWNIFLSILAPGILHFYNISPKTRTLTLILIFMHNLFNSWSFPYWGATANGLRAAGDVRFTMILNVIGTVCVRLFLSYILGLKLGLGVIGICIAMISDWEFRAFFQVRRVRSGKWKSFKLI